MTETYIIRVYLQHKEAKGLRKATNVRVRAHNELEALQFVDGMTKGSKNWAQDEELPAPTLLYREAPAEELHEAFA